MKSCRAWKPSVVDEARWSETRTRWSFLIGGVRCVCVFLPPEGNNCRLPLYSVVVTNKSVAGGLCAQHSRCIHALVNI